MSDAPQTEQGVSDEPLVTSEELDLRILEDAPRNLVVPVNFYKVDPDSGELVEHVFQEWITYPVRSQLPIPVMTSLLRLEKRINDALAEDDDDEADQHLQKALGDAYRRIVSLVVERTPHAMRELDHELTAGVKVKVRPQIELDTTQVLATLGWLAGDSSVADAIAKALTAGKSGALTQEQVEAEEGSAEASPAGPFRSSGS